MSIGAVDDVVAVASGSTACCGTGGGGWSGILPGAAETGTNGIAPVVKVPRIAGDLRAPGFSLASLPEGAELALVLDFAPDLASALASDLELDLPSLWALALPLDLKSLRPAAP